jgi:hypothetical protein
VLSESLMEQCRAAAPAGLTWSELGPGSQDSKSRQYVCNEPGIALSTTTSAVYGSAPNAANPRGCVTDTHAAHFRDSTAIQRTVCSTDAIQVGRRLPLVVARGGTSGFIATAPRSASCQVARAPGISPVRSSTRMPCSGGRRGSSTSTRVSSVIAFVGPVME